jgi:acetylornithine deacetylase
MERPNRHAIMRTIMSTEKTIAILQSLVGFDTTSRNSNLELIAWIERYLDGFGVAHRRVYDATGQKANLWATIGPADVPGYILSGHTDVVPVDGQEWASDPFRLTERDGKLYGRGACDMKGFLACCLDAVPDMLSQPLARPLHLAFSYDEEVGCLGVRTLIAKLGDFVPAPLGCFVGEPTSMDVVVGHKSKRSVRVTVHGATVHSSLAPHGVNAVEYGAKLIVKIREIADRLSRQGPRDPLYDVQVSTGHTGIAHGGTILNIVPDQFVFDFEFRTIAADDRAALVEEVIAYARNEVEPEMKKVSAQAGVTFDILSDAPGLEVAPEEEVVRIAKNLAGRNDHGKVAYGTEAGLYSEAAIPSVVVGPGSIDQAHKADEFIAISELVRCRDFITKLIARCAA